MSGIVTFGTGSGFYLQDAAGDTDPATSDAVFVARKLPSGVGPGARVEVEGRIAERLSRAAAPPNELTITEMVDAVVRPQGSGPLPMPVVIGAGGRLPPIAVVEDDGVTDFDPAGDGLDFWESLESMLVRVDSAIVVGPTNQFNETWVVGNGGDHATTMNAEGGITIAPGDFNPERIQLQPFGGLVGGPEPKARCRRQDHSGCRRGQLCLRQLRDSAR